MNSLSSVRYGKEGYTYRWLAGGHHRVGGTRQTVCGPFLSVGYGCNAIRRSGHRYRPSPVRRRCPSRANPRPLTNRWFLACLPLMVMIFANLRFNGYLSGGGAFHAADDLRGNTEFTGDAD